MEELRFVCHWGYAEDVCLIASKKKFFVSKDNNRCEIPLTLKEAKVLRETLKVAIQQCEDLESYYRE